MKKLFFIFLLCVLCISCQVTETITIDETGAGTITLADAREEQSYMQLVGEEYNKESFYSDSTYVFREIIAKNQETFSRLPDFEKKIFQKYSDVKVHVLKSAIDKKFQTTISHQFSKPEDIPDLYKTQDYADDIAHNYALVAEEHYYKVEFSLRNSIFKRSVSITNPTIFQKEKLKMIDYVNRYASFNFHQYLTLDYHFAHKIKSVSNPNAIISPDRKSLQLKMKLSDCLSDPESTNLEIVLESPAQ